MWVVFFTEGVVVLNHWLSPKDQFHMDGDGVPVELSLKVTVRGAIPEVGVPENTTAGTDEILTGADTFQPSTEAFTKVVPPPDGMKVVEAARFRVGAIPGSKDPGPDPMVKVTGIPSGRILPGGWTPSESYVMFASIVLV